MIGKNRAADGEKLLQVALERLDPIGLLDVRCRKDSRRIVNSSEGASSRLR
ncbi:MAG: hypothetical protein K6F50_02665 [Kiritimatiellae bacterium]|nr:hypothetical protein [Kiritimatiellia bacterium]